MKTMEQANRELVEIYTKDNEELKRKMIEIDAKIAECENKKLELKKKIDENIEFMRVIKGGE